MTTSEMTNVQLAAVVNSVPLGADRWQQEAHDQAVFTVAAAHQELSQRFGGENEALYAFLDAQRPKGAPGRGWMALWRAKNWKTNL